MSFSRRPGARFNRGRFAEQAAATSSGVSELIETLTIATSAAYAEGHTNVSMIGQPLATNPATGDQFGVYHADNSPSTESGRLAIFKITPANVVTVDTSSVSTNAQDSHNFFSMVVDGDGDLLLSGDMHGVPMNWQRLTGASIDFTGWATPPIEASATDEGSVTYPYFIKLASGDVLLFFRDGASGDGKLVLKKWTKATNTLAIVAVIVDGNVDGKSFYPHIPYFDEARGRIHCGGCWRDSPSINTNHDQIHFWLETTDNWATCTAKKADGSSQTLPVTVANAAYAEVTGTNIGLMNVGSITIGSDGHPRMFTYQDPGDGFTQIVLRRYTGSGWVKSFIPEEVQLQNGIPFSFVGVSGGTERQLSAPRALCDGVTDRTIIVHQSQTEGPGPRAWISERADCTQWVPLALDPTLDLGNSWFCAEDYYQWRTNGEIHALVQKSQLKNYGTEPDIGPQTLYRLRFRPKSTPYTYTAPAALWDPSAYTGCVAYCAPRGGIKSSGALNGIKVLGGGNPATINNVTELLDARDGSALFDQATSTARPTLTWNYFGTRKGGIRFDVASLDWLQSTASGILTPYNGVNAPLLMFFVVRFVTVAANQRVWSMGDTAGASAKYMELGTDATGRALFGRRVAGAAVVQAGIDATNPLTVDTDYVITAGFDGTNGWIRANGVQQGTTKNMQFATAGTWTHQTFGNRRRVSTNDLPGDHWQGAAVQYGAGTAWDNIAAIELAIAAEHGFSF